VITNNEIKILKSLSHKKYRDEHKLFLVEGLRLIKELVHSGYMIEKIWTTENFINTNSWIKTNLKKYDNINLIDEKYFFQILNTKNPQQIMALVSINQPYVIENLTNNIIKDKKILILDDISDPGNMGSLLRSAVWYDFDTIILSNNCVDIYNPKVVRSAMGAHFYISNFITGDLVEIIHLLKDNKYQIIGATLDGISYKKIKIENNYWALILGNEAYGISKELNRVIDLKISIPQRGPIESLNVAIAGSILLDRLIHE